ncbi:GNAT family N-acetyltransferase [Nocardioides sp. DS6]|uniref:Lysine N-acyltransferase MbtK n=1 Tax=Nocardioides eburneus TaxID=3231482 RepID=A0ABV3T1W8_9ACTN
MPTAVAVRHGAHRALGLTEDGESWAQAAARMGGGRPAYAVDLTGEVKEFTGDAWPVVALRPMTPGDLPSLVRWLSQEHVRRWFGVDGPPTPERVADRYAADIAGETATTMWVVETNGRSVGFCQDYRVGDYPDYALLTPDPEAIGVDYAIGEPAFVGRGLGTRMLWTWLLGVEARYPGARTCFAAPDHRNAASLRVLDKVGFARGTWFDEPQPDGTVSTVVGCTLDLKRVVGAGA